MCTFYLLFTGNFSFNYPLGLNGELKIKMEYSIAQIGCFSPNELLIQTLEPFWSPDFNPLMKTVVSGWPRVQ